MKIVCGKTSKPTKKYPYVGVLSSTTGRTRIILFTDVGAGVCLFDDTPTHSDNYQGEYKESWNESRYKPLSGSIDVTFTND